jgi:hypothetical protein
LESLRDEDEFEVPEQNMDPYFIEDKLPLSPLNYYDNDDGFWDDFIKKK